MKYFFILGSNPTLSIAELSAVFALAGSGQVVNKNVFILEMDNKIDANQIIKNWGGTIKIGVITSERQKNQERILAEIKKLLKPTAGKFKFGISYYGKNKFNTKPLAMEIKKYLRENKISCRWVTSRDKTLSSVVVEQNKLIDGGIEIVLIDPSPCSPPLIRGGVRGGVILIGQTLAVQPFKELSFRDYGRPARDDQSGMLPPKLAQIMINLAQPNFEGGQTFVRLQNSVLLDPFCGSGTILTEAMLMGYQNIIGSDVSNKAIADTKQNIKWIAKNYQLPAIYPPKFRRRRASYQLYNKNITELSQFIRPNSIDAIITEPYLGPQRGRINVNKVIRELEALYSKSLIEFKKALKSSGSVVMIWPIFRRLHSTYHITPDLDGFKIVNPIPKQLRKHKSINLTNRNTIIYGRKGQKIWREIVVMKRK